MDAECAAAAAFLVSPLPPPPSPPVEAQGRMVAAGSLLAADDDGGVGNALILAGRARSVANSVELFATVGETVGYDENGGVREEMLDACRESRSVAANLEKLCEAAAAALPTSTAFEAIVRTLRCLLAAVTRILLLADNVVVKQLLVSKETLLADGGSLQEPAAEALVSGHTCVNIMHHFTEFVKAFCDFGIDMIQLIHIIIVNSSDNHLAVRCERRRAQLDCARSILERSARLLLTSAKTFLAHADLPSARENRDAVFCQMRRALDLVHFMVKEGVVDCAVRAGLESDCDNLGFSTNNTSGENGGEEEERGAFDQSVLKSLRFFGDSVEIMRLSPVSESYKDQLGNTLNTIIERTQDFTDSAHTCHERRQTILMYCDKARLELAHLLRKMNGLEDGERVNSDGLTSSNEENGNLLVMGTSDLSPRIPTREEDDTMRVLLKTTQDLSLELQQTALETSSALKQNVRVGEELLLSIQDAAVSGDMERLQYNAERFAVHIDYVEDVAKLVRHLAASDAAQICVRHAQINLHIFGPQIALAGTTLCHHPHSQIAKANLDCFGEMWRQLVEEIVRITSQSQAAYGYPESAPIVPLVPHAPVILKQPPTPNQTELPDYPSQHMRLSPHRSPHHLDVMSHDAFGGFRKPISHSTSFLAPPDSGQTPFPQPLHPLPRRHSTSSVIPGQYPKCSYRPEDILNSFKDVENNEIVRRAKKMAGQANDMIAFTRGYGKVKTTQDLFTLAEYFAQEANLLYKVIRMFSYDVPTGEDKRSLMATADHVPKHCHQLQMLIQSPTVGKAATFTKVDSIIKAARQIMVLTVRVVEICFANANKYDLDFSNVTAEGKGCEEAAAAAAANDPS